MGPCHSSARCAGMPGCQEAVLRWLSPSRQAKGVWQARRRVWGAPLCRRSARLWGAPQLGATTGHVHPVP